MEHRDALARIVAGLDYNFACGVKLLFELESPTLEELRKIEECLNRSKNMKAEHKGHFVREACLGMRQVFVELQPSLLHFQALDVLETKAAKLAVVQLLELLRIEIFKRRQAAIPCR